MGVDLGNCFTDAVFKGGASTPQCGVDMSTEVPMVEGYGDLFQGLGV